MPKQEKTELENTTKDLLKELKIMVAFGANLKIPAIPGMEFYNLMLLPNEGDSYSLGYYSSNEAAAQALASWVLNQWDEMGTFSSAPWQNDDSDENENEEEDEDEEELRAKYIKEKTHIQIVEEYFGNDEDSFEIYLCNIDTPEELI